jgi:hypothetical protein
LRIVSVGKGDERTVYSIHVGTGRSAPLIPAREFEYGLRGLRPDGVPVPPPRFRDPAERVDVTRDVRKTRLPRAPTSELERLRARAIALAAKDFPAARIGELLGIATDVAKAFVQGAPRIKETA